MPSWTGFLLVSVLAAAGGGAQAWQDVPPEGGGRRVAQADETLPERPADVEALFARFARVPGLEARFTETKHLALLAVPLESRGRLYFVPTGHLTRIVEAPERVTLRITPDELRLSTGGKDEVIDLRTNARLREFVTSLVRVFRGDLVDLRRSFEVVYAKSETDPLRWTLTLTPRDEALQRMLKKLELHGARISVERIEVTEPNGDRSVTKIVEANAERVFTAEEQERLFGIPAPASKASAADSAPRR